MGKGKTRLRVIKSKSARIVPKRLARDYRQDLIQRLRDEEFAVLYLEAALREHDDGCLRIAVRDVVEALRLGSRQ